MTTDTQFELWETERVMSRYAISSFGLNHAITARTSVNTIKSLLNKKCCIMLSLKEDHEILALFR